MLEVSRDGKFAKEFKKKRWGAQKEMKEWCWGIELKGYMKFTKVGMIIL